MDGGPFTGHRATEKTSGVGFVRSLAAQGLAGVVEQRVVGEKAYVGGSGSTGHSASEGPLSRVPYKGRTVRESVGPCPKSVCSTGRVARGPGGRTVDVLDTPLPDHRRRGGRGANTWSNDQVRRGTGKQIVVRLPGRVPNLLLDSRQEPSKHQRTTPLFTDIQVPGTTTPTQSPETVRRTPISTSSTPPAGIRDEPCPGSSGPTRKDVRNVPVLGCQTRQGRAGVNPTPKPRDPTDTVGIAPDDPNPLPSPSVGDANRTRPPSRDGPRRDHPPLQGARGDAGSATEGPRTPFTPPPRSQVRTDEGPPSWTEYYVFGSHLGVSTSASTEVPTQTSFCRNSRRDVPPSPSIPSSQDRPQQRIRRLNPGVFRNQSSRCGSFTR